MMIHIPFDHIKVLDNGNYGCTLNLGRNIYCAVCTPDWDWIEPLHEEAYDPYQDCTYIRDRGFLELSSYYSESKLHVIDEELINLLQLNTNTILYSVVAEIDDYISDAKTHDDEFTVCLFTVRYLNQNADFAFDLGDTLAPYPAMSNAGIRFVFEEYQRCDFDGLLTMRNLGITVDSRGEISEATLDLIGLFECIYRTIEGCQQSPSKQLILDLSTMLLTLGYCESGLFEYTRLIYQKYLSPFVLRKY